VEHGVKPTRRAVKPIFSLSPVAFRDSPIEGRGVFAKRRFEPGEVVVAYAPKQLRVAAGDPRAAAAAESKVTLRSDETVIIPDTSVPGGWLCNHSCDPNAELFASGEGRIQCTRPIAVGEEVTIFYGWVTRNQPRRDPCRCASARCRGFINFDLSDADAASARIRDDGLLVADGPLREKLSEYEEYLQSIGQEHVRETIVRVLATMVVRT
jgi:SET domain-containing protein